MMTRSFFHKGLIISLVSSYCFASTPSITENIQGRLHYLVQEVGDLKKSRDKIEKKDQKSFDESVNKVDGETQQLESELHELSKMPKDKRRVQNNKLKVALNQIENEISELKEKFGEKNFGLADILGF